MTLNETIIELTKLYASDAGTAQQMLALFTTQIFAWLGLWLVLTLFFIFGAMSGGNIATKGFAIVFLIYIFGVLIGTGTFLFLAVL